MADAILKSDNADNNAAAAIQAGFASVNANLQSLAATNGDILRALKTAPATSRCCGCFCPCYCGSCACPCCAGSQSDAASIGCNTAYVVCNGQKSDRTIELVSYRNPIHSQAEVDKVDVIVLVGGEGARGFYGIDQKFTLDGFAIPGDLPSVVYRMDAYPCTFLRKQDGSGWIPLTRQDVVHGDWSFVIGVDPGMMDSDYPYMRNQMSCGLFEHNCRGKVFYARILFPEAWTDAQKQPPAQFYLKKDTIFYDSFPNNYERGDTDGLNPENYSDTPLRVGKDCESYNSSWGELIEKFGDKVFGVRVSVDSGMQGFAFAME